MSVQTVLGVVRPEEIGFTLTHEHMSLDFSHFYRPPPAHLANHFSGDICLQNVGLVRQLPYSSQTNLKFNGDDTNAAVLNDVMAYKRFGGGTIVENTTHGLGLDLQLLKNVSEATDVHVVAGAGFYIAAMQEASTLRMTTEDIYKCMLGDLSQGFTTDTTVKAGFLGEIASVWPIHDFEKRVIEAAAMLQEQLGCGVSFHPHRDKAAPWEILRLYTEAGGRIDKAVMSHLDRTLIDDEEVLEFSSLGSYCQWDLFGVEVSHYQLNPSSDMPSDAQRIAKVKLMVEEGKADRVLLSHDIHTKHRLIDFGGHGYSHIINNVLPKMRERGISEQVLDQITVTNPAQWLQFTV